jgi:hypothetical protein
MPCDACGGIVKLVEHARYRAGELVVAGGGADPGDGADEGGVPIDVAECHGGVEVPGGGPYAGECG